MSASGQKLTNRRKPEIHLVRFGLKAGQTDPGNRTRRPLCVAAAQRREFYRLMIVVSAPVIANLRRRGRQWAHKCIARGLYGRPVRLKGVLYVDVSVVETRHGTRFTSQQIEEAAGGVPHRVLTIHGRNAYASPVMCGAPQPVAVHE
jgi:hypothetical protein